MLTAMSTSTEPIVQNFYNLLISNDVPVTCPVPAMNLRIRNHRIDLSEIPVAAALISNVRDKDRDKD